MKTKFSFLPSEPVISVDINLDNIGMENTILIIEDEVILAEEMRRTLEKNGYRVELGIDGAAGLSLMRDLKPNLVLLDVLLPIKNGFEVMEEILKDPALASIPIIMISNSGQPIELGRARELGVKDFIIKAHFEPRQVLEKVEKFLPRPKIKKSPGAVKPSLPASSGPQNSESGVKILVIEDDQLFVEILCRRIIKAGLAVEFALDGARGLEIARSKKISLILLDLILPGMDGFEILKRLKQDPATSAIPVIILSNLGQQSEIQKGRDLGAVDYLVKAHYTPGEVVEKINSTLHL